MKPQDIEIIRSELGIFARAHSDFPGREITEVIWRKVGVQADPYRDKTDREIQDIVFAEWNRVTKSMVRRRKVDQDV